MAWRPDLAGRVIKGLVRLSLAPLSRTCGIMADLN